MLGEGVTSFATDSGAFPRELVYIQDTAKKIDVGEVTIFGVLAARVYKDEKEWHVVRALQHENTQTESLLERTKSAAYLHLPSTSLMLSDHVQDLRYRYSGIIPLSYKDLGPG